MRTGSPELALLPQAVVVHGGRRDDYQLALALQETGWLRALVTNVYWDSWVKDHCGVRLEPSRIIIDWRALAVYGAMRLFKAPNLHYYGDHIISKRAREIAYREKAAIFACSYSAYEAFEPGRARPPMRFLFQLHPHPISVRKILLEELQRTPCARESLLNEDELRLPDAGFEKMVCEPAYANGWAVASSFTANTLAENGIPRQDIAVVPYGLDNTRYSERKAPPCPRDPFQIVFLGSLVQRKGLSYLLHAVRLLHTNKIQVLLRSMGAPDPGILREYRDVPVDIKIGLPTPEIVRDLQRSDLFVFPSLVEGFAHVILQAMGCGLPVVTTTNTCAPDILTDSKDGFIVPIRDAEAIADKIQWGIDHRVDLVGMGEEAARTARQYTRERFRAKIREAYQHMCRSASVV